METVTHVEPAVNSVESPVEAESSEAVAALEKGLDVLSLSEPKAPEDNPDLDKYNVMVDWLIKGGSSFPKLELKYYSFDYRGIHAKEEIPPEETIVYIPFRYIMTTEVAKASEIGRRLLVTGCPLRSKHSYLAAYLLYEREKGAESFWHPYIACLPEKYGNMPINFDESELSWLKGSMAIQKIEQRIQSLHEEYDLICSRIPEFARFSYEDFSWARHVVITRIFGMVVGGLKTEGLVPLADLLNHRRPRETKWTYDNSLSGFTITTMHPLTVGEQVFDSYGRKCNSRFFVNYGFSLEENEDNEVVLKFEVTPNDPLYTEKERLLGHDINGLSREFQIPANTRERKTREMFSFIRYCVADEKDLKRFPTQYSLMIDDISPISARNEIEMLKLLKQNSQEALNAFDCSIEEDNRLLKDTTLSMNIRNAILMRRGEKQVAQYFINLADECIPLLQLTWNEFYHKCLTLYSSGDGPYDAYVSDVVRPLVRLN